MWVAVAAIVFLSIPVTVANYQRDEDAMERGRDMPPARKAIVVRIHEGARGNFCLLL